jgi:hypothetical protein
MENSLVSGTCPISHQTQTHHQQQRLSKQSTKQNTKQGQLPTPTPAPTEMDGMDAHAEAVRAIAACVKEFPGIHGRRRLLGHVGREFVGPTRAP